MRVRNLDQKLAWIMWLAFVVGFGCGKRQPKKVETPVITAQPQPTNTQGPGQTGQGSNPNNGQQGQGGNQGQIPPQNGQNANLQNGGQGAAPHAGHVSGPGIEVTGSGSLSGPGSPSQGGNPGDVVTSRTTKAEIKGGNSSDSKPVVTTQSTAPVKRDSKPVASKTEVKPASPAAPENPSNTGQEQDSRDHTKVTLRGQNQVMIVFNQRANDDVMKNLADFRIQHGEFVTVSQWKMTEPSCLIEIKNPAEREMILERDRGILITSIDDFIIANESTRQNLVMRGPSRLDPGSLVQVMCFKHNAEAGVSQPFTLAELEEILGNIAQVKILK